MPKPTRIPGLSRRSRLALAGPRIVAARAGDVELARAALPSPGAVHAMRVASRRLRAALRLFGLDDAPVKKLQDALGEVRDRHVQAEWLAVRDKALHEETLRALGPLQEKLDRALALWRAKTLPALLAAQVQARGKLGGHRMRRGLRKASRRFERRRKAALVALSPRATHRLRIAGKQLRYLAELLAPAVPRAKKLLEELEPLQDALGELHDTDVRIALLTRHARTALLREEQRSRERQAAILREHLAR